MNCICEICEMYVTLIHVCSPNCMKELSEYDKLRWKCYHEKGKLVAFMLKIFILCRPHPGNLLRSEQQNCMFTRTGKGKISHKQIVSS